jgi:hypothetical protein
MKKDTALVMSCHAHDVPGTWRINLNWQGNHDISNFELDRIGAVVRSENWLLAMKLTFQRPLHGSLPN